MGKRKGILFNLKTIGTKLELITWLQKSKLVQFWTHRNDPFLSGLS
jgi:hypothetical protein